MNIETVEDLAEQLADWFGIYGCCKSNRDEGCELDKQKPFCCRAGFVDTMIDRIEKAVENTKKLEQVELLTQTDPATDTGQYEQQ